MVRSVLAACLGVSIACGPSLRQAQTRVERYEQCYGADFDPSISPLQRRACWQSWLDERAEGDPPERVHYAELRLEQLSRDAATRGLPDPTPEPPPTYEHAYPRSPPSVYPTSACTPLCNDRWAECNTHCQMRDKDCLMACEAQYRLCIGGCP